MSVERTKQMIEVMQAYVDGKEIETTYLHNEFWAVVCNPVWNWNEYDYRVKELTKPSINWDEVSDDYNYLAQGRSGDLFLHKEKPRVDVDYGWIGMMYYPACTFKSATPGTCDWKDSLVERPNKGDI